jgi:protein tyrosine/serine phosphatase
MWPIVILVVILILALAGWVVWRAKFATYHFATVQAGVLYRDGCRSEREFEHATQISGAKTVVMLIDDREATTEPFVSEVRHCKEKGIEIVRIPIALGGWPTGEQVREFLKIADDHARQPVLVHCAQGVRRTGMFVAAFQESVLGYDDERTKHAILRFGHSDRSINDVKRFVDVYDPKLQDMTTQLEMSTE